MTTRERKIPAGPPEASSPDIIKEARRVIVLEAGDDCPTCGRSGMLFSPDEYQIGDADEEGHFFDPDKPRKSVRGTFSCPTCGAWDDCIRLDGAEWLEAWAETVR